MEKNEHGIQKTITILQFNHQYQQHRVGVPNDPNQFNQPHVSTPVIPTAGSAQ